MRKQIRRSLKEIKSAWERWPVPPYDVNDQPHFLFIITPPYSGSTALCELINSSHKTMALHTGGEGQWLVPGLCDSDMWEPDKKVNYASVRAVWLAKYQEIKRLTHNVSVVIEKSPPNMMRLSNLISLFRDVSLLANNRDPYANVSSTLHRNYKMGEMNGSGWLDAIRSLTERWLDRSMVIKRLVEEYKIPLLTYEKFCRDPRSVIDLLNLPEGVVESIDSNANVKVKDYGVQPIVDHNSRQIAKLSRNELDLISEVLAPHKELLEYFGYSILA